MFWFYVYGICNWVNEDSYACIALNILRLTVIDKFFIFWCHFFWYKTDELVVIVKLQPNSRDGIVFKKT